MVDLQDIKDFEGMIAGLQDHQTVEVTVSRLKPFIVHARCSSTDPTVDEAIFYRNAAMSELVEARAEIERLETQLAGERVRVVQLEVENQDLRSRPGLGSGPGPW